MKKTLCTLILVAATNTGYAHDAAGCSNISNLLARLSCYDEGHDGEATSATSAIINDTKNLEQSSSNAASSGDANSTFGLSKRFFSDNKSNSEAVQATLTEMFKHPKKMTKLYLDNKQVWGLVKERMMSASAGDAIRIKTGTMGGYLMSINDGAWFRVKRLK